MKMTTKIQKWGNSLAVRIPKELINALSLKEGFPVSFKKVNQSIVIESNAPRFTLNDMEKSSKKKIKVFWGYNEAKGKEIW